MTFSLQSDGMDEVTFQNLEEGCVRDKEPTHLPLGCSIRNLVKVSWRCTFLYQGVNLCSDTKFGPSQENTAG